MNSWTVPLGKASLSSSFTLRQWDRQNKAVKIRHKSLALPKEFYRYFIILKINKQGVQRIKQFLQWRFKKKMTYLNLKKSYQRSTKVLIQTSTLSWFIMKKISLNVHPRTNSKLLCLKSLLLWLSVSTATIKYVLMSSIILRILLIKGLRKWQQLFKT